jgi:O-antigen ligase
MVSRTPQGSLGIAQRQRDGKQWPQAEWFPFLLAFLALTLGVSAVVIPPYIYVGVVALAVVASLVLLNFESALLLILIIRPCLDMEFFQNYNVYRTTTNVGLDAAAAVNMLITLVGILYILAHKINIFKSSVSKATLVFVSICAFTTIFSSDRVLTLAQTTIVVSHFVLYIAFATVIRSRKQVNRLLTVYLLAAVVPSAMALYQVLTSASTYRVTGVPRVSGVLTTRASLGAFMILPLTITVILFLRSDSLIKRIGYGILLMFFAIPFFFSLTRVGWAGFVLVLFILMAFRYRKLLLLIPVALIILWVTIPAISLRFSDVSLQNPETSTLGFRLKMWNAAIDIFESSPIVGVGFGVADTRAGFIAIGSYHPVHNTYLRVLADTGLVGFIAYMGLLFSFLWDAASSYRKLSDSFYRTLAIGFVGICASLMWQRMWGNHVTTSVRQFYFWSYAALVYALVWVERKELHHHSSDEKGVVSGSGVSESCCLP